MMIYRRQEGRGVKGRMEGCEDGRGVDSIISNFMAAFNGNTITFEPSGVGGEGRAKWRLMHSFIAPLKEERRGRQPASQPQQAPLEEQN